MDALCQHCLTHLDAETLAVLATTCKRFFKAIHERDDVWRKLVVSKHPAWKEWTRPSIELALQRREQAKRSIANGTKGARLHLTTVHNSSVRGLFFSSCGSRLAVACSRYISLFSISPAALAWRKELRSISELAVSEDWKWSWLHQTDNLWVCAQIEQFHNTADYSVSLVVVKINARTGEYLERLFFAPDNIDGLGRFAGALLCQAVFSHSAHMLAVSMSNSAEPEVSDHSREGDVLLLINLGTSEVQHILKTRNNLKWHAYFCAPPKWSGNDQFIGWAGHLIHVDTAVVHDIAKGAVTHFFRQCFDSTGSLLAYTRKNNIRSRACSECDTFVIDTASGSALFRIDKHIFECWFSTKKRALLWVDDHHSAVIWDMVQQLPVYNISCSTVMCEMVLHDSFIFGCSVSATLPKVLKTIVTARLLFEQFRPHQMKASLVVSKESCIGLWAHHPDGCSLAVVMQASDTRRLGWARRLVQKVFCSRSSNSVVLVELC